jgi:hypothetical protein
MIEEWRPIPGFNEWYEASNLGNVRSWINGRFQYGRREEPRILKKQNNSTGYNVVGLRPPVGRCRTYQVHPLILETFVGPRPKNMQACHNDGDPFNNRLNNLRWDTQSGNQMDRRKHGTDNRGERCGKHKLTEGEVRQIRAAYIKGSRDFGGPGLSKQFNVSKATIRDVITRRTWRHV